MEIEELKNAIFEIGEKMMLLPNTSLGKVI